MSDTISIVTRRWRACLVIPIVLAAVLTDEPVPARTDQVFQQLVQEPHEAFVWPVSNLLDSLPGEQTPGLPDSDKPPLPPTIEDLLPLYFGFDTEKARRVLNCESHFGVGLADENVWQIDQPTWQDFFLRTEGWEWSDITGDLDHNFQAARIIWDRGGWAQWHCS